MFLFPTYLQNELEYCCRIVYPVSHKTSLLFVILLLTAINGIYHFRCGVLPFWFILSVLLKYRWYFRLLSLWIEFFTCFSHVADVKYSWQDSRRQQNMVLILDITWMPLVRYLFIALAAALGKIFSAPRAIRTLIEIASEASGNPFCERGLPGFHL